MKKVLAILLFATLLNAGIMDVFKIKDAQKAFKSGDYNKTIQEYSKIKKPTDEVRYNLGEAYYKAKRYKEALKEFSAVKSKKLEFKKLHNMGNSFAKLGKIDKAIKAYEKALKIKEDKDTRYNLELLKKLKKKQQQKKNNNQNKKKQQKKDNKQQQNNKQKNGGNKGQNKKQNQKNNQNSGNKDNKNKQNKNRQNQNQQNKQKKESNSKNSAGEKKDKKKLSKDSKKSSGKKDNKKDKKQKAKIGEVKKVPISDMELRKYNKMLDKRGIKTLMLPLSNKGAKQNEKNINPW